ncbi:MAG: efflux RND transporter permease subunit [Chromatiales bacterium]|nr:efflux RND transporter permease subunit [Gammaproteobacteria bacterium]MCP5352907.1 efflux RND transporter permease subunit [Chromatiales bacterium]
MSEAKPMGIAGRVAAKFLHTEITPLLALVGLLLGALAVMITPREEEPQINVTFANVFIPFPGATAEEVADLVSTPAEQILSEIDGLDHIYSASRPGLAVLTVRFKVGEDRTAAIVRLYNKVYSNQDWLPANLGVGTPIIKPKGIDDVPMITITLWADQAECNTCDLIKTAHAIEAELKRVKGTRNVYTVGGPDRVVHVRLDAQRLAGYSLSLDDLRLSLAAANSASFAGSLVRDNEEIPVQAGTFMTTVDEIGGLVVGVFNGSPVYLRDVADVRLGPSEPTQYVSFGTGPAAAAVGLEPGGPYPAVTIAVAKKAGTNAVKVSKDVIKRLGQLEGTFIPENIRYTVTRDYGATAEAKAQKLMGKLTFATAIVVVLVFFALGKREAVIVGLAIVITLALTLFASWAWGFTLNRVSLFALIFSIGILVDDAIVVVENIHRHMVMGGKSLAEAIPPAVDEVGGPTILATFTVIAALLPMAFVTGLMGPYMSPIPINASMGMIISLAVAFVVTPWLTLKVLGKQDFSHAHDHSGDDKMEKLFRKYVGPFLRGEQGDPLRKKLLYGILIAIALALSLAAFKIVVLKMLPFDNKSEFQIVLDMPEGTALEQTTRVLDELSEYIRKVPEVTDYQVYSGTATPIGFNGLVRQYYLREGPNVGDIQVNLIDAHDRDRSSHEIALSVRKPLQEIGARYNANVKIVEVPPGPPVMSPLVAEIYGLNYEGQQEVANEVRAVFAKTPDIVDIDDSMEELNPRFILRVDREKAALLGVHQQKIAAAISSALGGEDIGYLHGGKVKFAIPIRLQFPAENKADLENLLTIKVHGFGDSLVPLADLVEVREAKRERAIYHKDLLPVVFVTGDMAGDLDSPLYGMFEIRSELMDKPVADGTTLKQYLIDQPQNPYRYSVKWDGEWQVTYETFRDMGIAYSVGLFLIYLLVVAQFRSYVVPLVIMAPIPLTVIGVMPGHALLGAQFTATSMIGMIALAGIIVRNSILLVDFINEEVRRGVDFEEAVIQAGAARTKPIVLTGLAAVLGAFFIVTDPIFGGLAVSLIFGIVISTLLTLVVIPVVYYATMYRKLDRILDVK